MSKQYFKHLNYTLANEDTALEYTVLCNELEHVFCVCGSGSRVLPLLAKKPKILSLVDFSSEQIALTKLRLAAVEQLEYEEFLSLLGYKNDLNRIELFESLKLEVQVKDYLKNYFQTATQIPLIYQGQYEKALISISKIIKTILGKRVIFEMKEIQTQAEFKTFLKSHFPHLRWKLILLVLGNSSFMNALLYKGSHPKKNIPLSYYQFYQNMFEKLFSLIIPSESFLIQMIFFGELIDLKGAPLEASKEIFMDMKAGIKNCQINFYHGDLVNIIKEKISRPIDFISFSDTLSYFPKELENSYLQDIAPRLNQNAISVHRYYLRKHFHLDTKGFNLITAQFRDEITQEKTQIYDIEIFQKGN